MTVHKDSYTSLSLSQQGGPHRRKTSHACDSRFKTFPAEKPIRSTVGRAAVVIKPASAQSLSKTGIFAERARDFRRFPPPPRQTRSPETKANARKARISGPSSRLLGNLAERRTGWLGREDSNLDRTNSKSDVVACPRGVEEPHFTTIHKPLETFEFREPYRIRRVQSSGDK
jgi:hypothetical protein